MGRHVNEDAAAVEIGKLFRKAKEANGGSRYGRIPAARGAYAIDPDDLAQFRPGRRMAAGLERRCLDCGKVYAKRRGARFCSDQCLQNAYRRRKRAAAGEAAGGNSWPGKCAYKRRAASLIGWIIRGTQDGSSDT